MTGGAQVGDGSGGAPVTRGRDLDRFLTFLDAVVAIAITLLVLPLVEVAAEVRPGNDVGEVLGEHVDQFVAFALGFIVISRLWFAQHAVLRPVVAVPRPVPALLMVWLLAIVALPFNTALIAQASRSGVTQGLYLGTLIVGSGALSVVSRLVARDRRWRDGPPSDPAKSVAVTLVFVVTLVVAYVVPAASFWPLLLLYVADPLAEAWRRRRGPLPD